LKTEIRIVDVIAADDRRGVDGKGGPGKNAADAVALNRLDQIFGLSWTVVVTGADAEDRVVAEFGGRPREGQPRAEVQLRTLIWGIRGRPQNAAPGIEEHLQVPDLPQHRVVLIAQAIIHGEVRTDLPFILRVAHIVSLARFAFARGAAVKGTGRAYVAQELHLRGFIVEQVVNVRKRVGRAAQPVGINANRANFHAELVAVAAFDPAQLVHEAQRVVGVRLSASVLRAVGADQSSQAGAAG